MSEKDKKKSYSLSTLLSQFKEFENERSEWTAEFRELSDFLLPGRGIYQTYTKPRKRKLTSGRVINTIAEDSLYVLTSGMHGWLTSPSKPWFNLAWEDQNLNKFEPLKSWLEQVTGLLHDGLSASNFYGIINSFYVEYAGFGTGSLYVGEDTGDTGSAFRFELLTAGEYAFSVDARGVVNRMFRTLFMSKRQLVERFPDTVSSMTLKEVEEGSSQVDTINLSILECVFTEPYQDKPITRVFYELTGGGAISAKTGEQEPLEVSGFYEFPYPTARWSTIGSDVYGIGPGSRALPDIKRLQEMEKAFLMATHKTINPPLNAPARMRGKLDTLPGGKNYYANPQETVNEIYQIRFDYQGVGSAIQRVEQRIQRNFFNDIFLTAARDPNATPYKATEVMAREQEKMLRMGPVIERLQHEFLQPIIERCFNIMLRKELLPMLPPELAKLAGRYKINLVSPLATAQKSVAIQGINSFLAFVAQGAQFDPSIMDNVNIDAAAREYADISGVNLGILRPAEEVAMIRQQRAEAEAAARQKQEQLQMAQMQMGMQQQQADIQKTQAEAGQLMVEGQETAQGMGML